MLKLSSWMAILVVTAVCIDTSASLARDVRGAGPPALRFAPSALAAEQCPSSPLDPPDAGDTTFVADCDDHLDTGCTFKSDVPNGRLRFPIMVDRVVGNRDKLKANGLIRETATLTMPAFDVDFSGGGSGTPPERDRVSFNGHVLTPEFLSGQDNEWKLNQYEVPIEWVEFPNDPDDGGTVEPKENFVEIEIDTLSLPDEDTWCTAIDWATLQIDVARPVVYAHGILSDGGVWDASPFRWLSHLRDELGIPSDNGLDMGPLDSIQSNAGKIAGRVARARARWGVDKVDLVAHSKGGLDSREYVEGHDDVERVIQLGTPNAGSPLADTVEAGVIRLLGPIPALLINVLATPAGYQLTTFYMDIYNSFHGRNAKVRYTALAGRYDPDCFPLFSLSCAADRAMEFIVGSGDLIVPVSSVHALPYTSNRTFASSGGNRQATHTSLEKSESVYDRVSDQIEVFGDRSAKPQALALANGSTPVLTITSSIAHGEVHLRDLPIDEQVPTTITLFFPNGDLDLSLISPSGVRLDASTVIGRADVARGAGEILGGFMESYALTLPEVGIWKVEVAAASVTDPSGAVVYSVSSWMENPTTRMDATIADPYVAVGDSVRLEAQLSKGASPQLGATVSAIVLRSDQTRTETALLDDGVGADTVAGDGRYAALFTDTSAPGMYRVLFSATGGSPAFAREQLGLFTVSSSSVDVGGAITDFGEDSDGDGLFNELVVQIPLTTTAAGDYLVAGTLRDPSGNTHEASAQVHLAAGGGPAQLRFDGESIYNNGVDGPYTLAELKVAEVQGMDILPVLFASDVHQTTAYNHRSFQHAALRLNGTGSAVGVDNNANGLFDRLVVDVGVDVATAATYEWTARLTDRNGVELGFAAGSGFLAVGENSLRLEYSGASIGANCLDGPYSVRGLLAFGAGSSLVANLALTTESFKVEQFEGGTSCSADLGVTKEATPTSLAVGEEVTYVLTASNSGPGDGRSVIVTDTLPSGLGSVSVPAGCSISGTTITCALGDLLSGTSQAITITGIATAAGTLTNQADVSGERADGESNNDSDQAVVEVTGTSEPIVATFLPTRDTYLRKGNSNANEGASPLLQVGRPYRALLDFDLDAIRATVESGGLVSAKLVLAPSDPRGLRRGRGRTFSLHRLQQSWVEGNGKNALVPLRSRARGEGTGATWNCAADANIANQQPECGSSGWSLSRPDRWPFLSTPIDEIAVAPGAEELELDLTEELCSILSSTSATYGFILKGSDVGPSGRLQLSSREGEHPPRLEIEFAPGAAGSCAR